MTASLIPVNVVLTLRGPCPAKKNLLKFSRKSGKPYRDEEVELKINSLTIQARSQWGQRPPVRHPDVRVTFYLTSGRPDRDNRLTTVLDCIQKAGVIRNDNATHFNGRLTLEPALFVNAAKERVEVEITA